MPMTFQTDCVSSSTEAVTAMLDKERPITRRTFLRHVDRDNLRRIEADLGYERHPSRGLTMAGDWHVSYGKSFFLGRPCVFFAWSAIEHIFTE